MSGVEAFGLALGCTGLVFSLIPSVLDYRALPEHVSELQDFIKRQKHYLAAIEADFKYLLDWEMLSPGTLLRQAQMTDEEVEDVRNFLIRYRKCLDEFSTMLSGISRGGSPYLKRLRLILGGKTGMGIGTLQAKQNFLQMYMLEARTYRRRLENVKRKNIPSRLSKVRMGQTAAAAYKVPALQQMASYLQQPNNLRNSDYYNDFHYTPANNNHHLQRCCHHATPALPPTKASGTGNNAAPHFHAPWPVHPIAASTFNFDKPHAPGYEINRSDSVSPTDTLVGSVMNMNFNDFGQDIEKKQEKVHDSGAGVLTTDRHDDVAAELRFQRKQMAGIPITSY